MIKKEAKFISSVFHPWLRAHPMHSAPFEFKQTKEFRIPFSSVSEHQLNALMACKSNKGFFYKVSDESQGYKPFDGFYFRNSPAYIVIKFPHRFDVIDVETFIMEKNASDSKSLTSKRSLEISIFSVILKK